MPPSHRPARLCSGLSRSLSRSRSRSPPSRLRCAATCRSSRPLLRSFARPWGFSASRSWCFSCGRPLSFLLSRGLSLSPRGRPPAAWPSLSASLSLYTRRHGLGRWVCALCGPPGPPLTPSAASWLWASSLPWDWLIERPAREKDNGALNPGSYSLKGPKKRWRQLLPIPARRARTQTLEPAEAGSAWQPVLGEAPTYRDVPVCWQIKPKALRESERKERGAEAVRESLQDTIRWGPPQGTRTLVRNSQEVFCSAMLRSMGDLSSMTRIEPEPPALEAWSLKH